MTRQTEKDNMTQWENKIVGYKQVPANELLANPMNARHHPPAQREALRGSLDTLGFVAPVLVNINTQMLIDGHARVEEVLTKDENALIPVIEVDITEDEEKLFLASFDWITQLATYDSDRLDALLHEVQTDDNRLQAMLSEMATEFDLYFGDEPEPIDPPEPQIDRAAELQEKWQVKRGNLYQIGKHRLLCGDSTNEVDVARLMDGEKAEICFTSPPYNAGNQKTGAYGSGNRTDYKEMYLHNLDSMSSDDYKKFLLSVLTALSCFVNDESPILWNVCYNSKSRCDYGEIVFSESNPFSVKETIIWDKGVGMNISNRGILSRTCEFVFLMSMGSSYFTNQQKK